MDPGPNFNYDEENHSSSLPSPEDAHNSLAMAEGSARENNDNNATFVNGDHDSSQLPSVEEARMAAPRRSSSSLLSGQTNSKKKKVLGAVCLAAFLIVAAVVAVSVLTTQGGNSGRQGGGGPSELEFLPLDTGAEGGTTDSIAVTKPPKPGKAPAPTGDPTASPSASPTVRASDGPTSTPSVSPTHHPTLSREAMIFEILKGVSRVEDLENVGSPQQKAYQWIAYVDTLEVPVTNIKQIVQRYVLVVLYYSMGGPSWRSKLNFNSHFDECSWFRTFRAYKLKQLGVTCNADGKVLALNFPKDYLVGTFPKELAKLDALERLDVFNNKRLVGFPEFLKGMKKINHLALHYCDMIGTLPDWIGDLTTLKSLVLSNNEHQGALPDSMARLTNLENLYLDDNQFQGSIDVLRHLTSLRNLVLEDNQFTGSFDDNMIQNWKNLETLDASHNRLQSTIPAGLLAIKNLRIIDLHENRFFGTIPEYSPANTALEMLTLNNNDLAGQIPSILGKSFKLRHVDLTNNKFTSTIPQAFGSLTNLEILYLAQNDFDEAPIPASFANLESLAQISLKGTARTGTIPSWFGNLSALTMLDLDSNFLSGAIPPALGNLNNLEYLLVNRNKLQGEIPAELSALSRLSFFVADKNQLTGSADAVCTLPNAQDLFASADCRGENPEVTCTCCNVCCEDGDSACNDDVWLADSNPMWELEYRRAVTVEFDAQASRTYTIQFTGDIPP